MKRYKYKIIINKESKTKPYIYKYGHTDGIMISVSQQCATIEFVMKIKKDIKDFIALKSDLFKDAYRKVYLIHAVRFSHGLSVKMIRFFIDDDEYSYDEKKDLYKHFPFVFSMISCKDLKLGPDWKGIENEIVLKNKSQCAEDLRFSSLYSLLASKSREYEIDKFGNLWTAMNAFYKFIANSANNANNLKIGKMTESNQMRLMACIIESNIVCIPTEKEKNEKWKNNYSFEQIVDSFTYRDFEDLYLSSQKELNGEILPEKYSALNEIAKEFGVKLFVYILLVYPYRLRCEYFHGEASTMLIVGYNDYKLHVLSMINYFLDRYLTEKIPLLFGKEFEQKMATADIKEYMCNVFRIKKW